MNLLLLNAEELLAPAMAAASHRVLLSDWRARHIIETLGLAESDTLKTALVDAGIGEATVTAINREAGTVELHLATDALDDPAPPALPLRAFIALPRPKAARRILRLLAECGVKQIHFFNAWKVEKSYWSSPELAHHKVREQFLLGLAQSGDTMLPSLTLHKLFRPFVEDTLPQLVAGQPLLLGDPYSNLAPAVALERSQHPDKEVAANIVVGPEGGLTPYESTKLAEAGAIPVTLGTRIYRSEIALALVLGELRPQLAPQAG